MTTSRNTGNSASPVAWKKGNKANDKNIKSEILTYKGFSGIQ